MDRSVTTTRHVEGTWVVLDGAKYVRARVSASSDMDETPGQLMTKFGDVWRINVMANEDGLTSDEARKLGDALKEAADWIDQIEAEHASTVDSTPTEVKR